MSSKHMMVIAVVLVMAGSQLAAQRGSMRFQGMDRNNDGRISRAEWNGNDQSFKVHDWNGDGVLSGEEVRSGGRGAGQDTEWDDTGRAIFTDWTVRGFNGVDRNRDNRITADEWRFDRDSFRRADHNRDGVVTRSEFLNEDFDEGPGRDDRFASLDANSDNRISRAEWRGTRANFDLLDDNRDGILTRAEVVADESAPDLFSSVDANRNGTLSRNEWQWSPESFDRLDTNRDGRLTMQEFSGTAQGATGSPAYQAGHDRGLIEGRAAGREDRERNQGWDLEGQRELEQADSGYLPAQGSRTDYQAGYRAAFRVGYQEGYGPR